MATRASDEGEESVPQMGRGEALHADGEDELWPHAGVLWVPDPRNRGGWGQYFVSKAKPPQAASVLA